MNFSQGVSLWIFAKIIKNSIWLKLGTKLPFGVLSNPGKYFFSEVPRSPAMGGFPRGQKLESAQILHKV